MGKAPLGRLFPHHLPPDVRVKGQQQAFVGGAVLVLADLQLARAGEGLVLHEREREGLDSNRSKVVL